MKTGRDVLESSEARVWSGCDREPVARALEKVTSLLDADVQVRSLT